MTERPLIEQLEDALSGDFSHNIVRVWAWVRISHAGSITHEGLREQFTDARSALADGLRLGVFKATKDEVLTSEWPKSSPITQTGEPARLEEDSAEEEPTDKQGFQRGGSVRPRKRRKRASDAPVSERLSTMTGRDRIRYAFDHPHSRGCQVVIRDVAARVSRAYKKAYNERTGRLYWDNMITKNARSFRMIAKWCTEQGIRYAEWFRFCEKTYRQRSKRKAFPAPANCIGTWILEQWGEVTGSKEHRHAGHTYKEVSKDLRSQLIDAGFDVTEYDDDMIEYIESRAKDKSELPEAMYEPDSDSAIETIVDWISNSKGVANGNG